MAYRFETSEVSVRHLLASLSETGCWRCMRRKMPNRRLYGHTEFDEVAISATYETNSYRDGYQVVAFPCFPTLGGSFVVDFGTPMVAVHLDELSYKQEDVERLCNDAIRQVMSVSVDAEKPEQAIPYLIMQLER